MTGASQADEPTVPCGTCGAPTTSTGTERCNRCWEVERRLADYLRAGGEKARSLVNGALNTPGDEDAALAAANSELAKLCGCGDAKCKGTSAHQDGFLVGYRARGADVETARAADLWARLVTLWESHDSADVAARLEGEGWDNSLVVAIAGLIDEWQGFMAAPAAKTPIAEEDDDDSAFQFIAYEGLVDEYNAWCAAAPERAQGEALFGVWQAELKAAQVAAGCSHPDGTICPNCKGHGNLAKWLAERKKQTPEGA